MKCAQALEAYLFLENYFKVVNLYVYIVSGLSSQMKQLMFSKQAELWQGLPPTLWLCYLKVERNLKGEEEKRLRLVDPMKRWSAFIFLTLLPSSLQVTFRFFFPRTESFYPVFFKHYVISLAKPELRPLSFIFFWVMFWQSVEREKII